MDKFALKQKFPVKMRLSVEGIMFQVKKGAQCWSEDTHTRSSVLILTANFDVVVVIVF